jgi:hypothetical protein
VIKAPTSKGPKASSDPREETKGESGIGGFRKVTDSVTMGGKAEATIVGADRRTLSGMNMTLASKDKYKYESTHSPSLQVRPPLRQVPDLQGAKAAPWTLLLPALLLCEGHMLDVRGQDH